MTWARVRIGIVGAIGVAVVLLCAMATRAQGPQTGAPPAGTSAISGIVVDASTGAPLAGASVYLLDIRNASGQFQDLRFPAALTDSKGRFVFTNLPSMFSYGLGASRMGYNVGSPVDDVNIKLTDGEWKRDVTIRMPRVSSITGRVTDERGEPVVGTTVRLFARRLVAGHTLVLGAAASPTDDRGVYRMTFLEPGTYFVAVLSVQSTVPSTVPDAPRLLPLGGLDSGRSMMPTTAVAAARGASVDGDGTHRLVLTNFATPPPAGGGARAYPPTFYPNARTLADALAVEVPAGGGLTNIDMQITPVASATISGRVSGATQDAPNMLLRLMIPGSEHLSFGSEVATTVVEPDGAFAFLNVPHGDYTLVSSSVMGEISTGQSTQGLVPRAVGLGQLYGYSTQYRSTPNTNFMWWQSQGGSTASARTPVSVGGDVRNLDVVLHPTATVRGHVVADDPAGLGPNGQFDVTLEPANADPSLGAFESYTRGDTHEFSMTGLRPARYLLRVGPAFRGWRVSSVISDGVDLTKAGFDASSGQNFSDVVVSVTKSGAALSGTVHTREGAPATGAVILFATDPKSWTDYGFTPTQLQSVNTDSTGRYQFQPFGEGEYFVIAVPMSQSKAWIDPRFLAVASTQATRLTMSKTSTKTQDLAVAEVIVK